jgi:phage terminase small subunit
MKKKGLTPKQTQFVKEYLVDLNATQAAIRAKYSKKTANEQGARLLANVSIAAAIQKEMDARSHRVNVTSDDVLRELLRLSLVDVTQAFDKDGRLLPIKEIPEDVRRAIAGIDLRTQEASEDDEEDSPASEAVRIKFYDKTKSLDLLGRHLKLWTDKQPLNVNVNLSYADRLRRARQRLQKRASR